MSCSGLKEAVPASHPPDSTAVGSDVWDRVWRHEPSAAKDDRLLDRERLGPRWRMIVDRLTRRFGSLEGVRAIELGSGRGDLSALLASRGARVTLLDASDMALEQARRRFDRLGLSATMVRGDFFALGELAGRFDVSLSSGVIEHFRGGERTRSIGAHHDALDDGGMTVISVPHAWCPTYRIWKAYLELRGWWPYGMEIPYSAREIRKRTLAAGFSTCETAGMGFWPSVADHGVKTLVGRRPNWDLHTSVWDNPFGGTLVAFGYSGYGLARVRL
ncbi:MAG: class I SAM-dependent methyltransferase [Planctomycetota bacterium]|jgi:SAM-dependent methyltransferase